MGVIILWLSGGIMAARGGVCQLMRRLSKATDAQKIWQATELIDVSGRRSPPTLPRQR